MAKLVFYFSDNPQKCLDKVIKREEELAQKGIPFRLVSGERIDALTGLSDERLRLFKEYIIDDAGSCTPSQVDFVFGRLRDELGLDVTAVGRRCDESGRPFEGAMSFLAGADEINRIADSEESGTVSLPPRDTDTKAPRPKPAGAFQSTTLESKDVISEDPGDEGYYDEAEEEADIPPELEMFLEAKTHADRLDVFRRIKEKCDDKIIDTLAVILDIEVSEGDIEKRRQDVMTCLETRVKYELTRR